MCAQDQNQSKCQHTDEERALTGTWVTLELDKAVDKGYRILKTFEIWHFEKTCHYDPVSKTGGIFTKYINHATALKQEASGFPLECVTLEQKQQYVDDYYEHEGGKNKISNLFFQLIKFFF